MSKGKPLFACVITDAAIEARVRAHGTKVIETTEPQKLREFREVVLSRMVKFWDDHKDIKIAIGEALAQFARREELVGWVRPSTQADMPALADEIARLSKENAELRAKSQDVMTEERYLGLSFAELESLLGKKNLIGLFWRFRDKDAAVQFAPAKTYENAQQLLSLGLLEQWKDGVFPATYVVSETGRRFLNRMEFKLYTQCSLKFRGKSQMRSGLCLLRPKLPAHTASDMLRCGKMTVLDSLCASGRTMGALLRRYLRRHQVGVQHGRQVQQRQDARLQRRQRRQMPDLRPGRREDRQRELLKGLQQPFGGRPLGGALRLSGVQAAQFLARRSQLTVHAVFGHRQQPRRQGQQPDQPQGVVVPVQVERDEGQPVSLEPPKEVFDDVFHAIGQHGLGEGQFRNRRLGQVDPPAQQPLGLLDGRRVTLDGGDDVTHVFFRVRRLPAIGPLGVHGHLPPPGDVQQPRHPVVAQEGGHLCLQRGLFPDRVLATPAGRRQLPEVRFRPRQALVQGHAFGLGIGARADHQAALLPGVGPAGKLGRLHRVTSKPSASASLGSRALASVGRSSGKKTGCSAWRFSHTGCNSSGSQSGASLA